MHDLSLPETPLPEEKLDRPEEQAEHGILARLAHDEPERFEIEESRLRRDPTFPSPRERDRIPANPFGARFARGVGSRV